MLKQTIVNDNSNDTLSTFWNGKIWAFNICLNCYFEITVLKVIM